MSAITVTDLPRVAADADAVADGAFYAMRTAKKRQLRIVITQQADVDDDTKGAIARVVIEIPAGLATTDPTVLATDGTDTELNISKIVQHTITLSKAPALNDSRPNVVSIQRLRPGSQSVVSAFEEAKVTGAFDVKIVFTELPHDFKLAMIAVDGGTASNLVVGVPFAWYGVTVTDSAGVVVEAAEATRASAQRPHPSEGMYMHNAQGALAGVPQGMDGYVPLPTGADEMYHQYRVTITPHRRADTVKINIKDFHDNAVPFPNIYKPFDIENKPNGREQLRLAVATTTLTALGAGFMFYLPHGRRRTDHLCGRSWALHPYERQGWFRHRFLRKRKMRRIRQKWRMSPISRHLPNCYTMSGHRVVCRT